MQYMTADWDASALSETASERQEGSTLETEVPFASPDLDDNNMLYVIALTRVRQTRAAS